MTSNGLRLRCLNCSASFDVTALVTACQQCGSEELCAPSTMAVDPTACAANARDGIWRFASALPAVDARHRVSLGEGATPLLALDIEGSPVWVKYEAVAPTGSYKDRFNAVNVSVALTLGYSGLALASTGNAGLSAAAYGARAGLRVKVYCHEECPPVLRKYIETLGAQVAVISGREAEAALDADIAEGFFPGSRARPNARSTPFGCEGYKTIAYEIVDALGRAPDHVYLPVGGGDGLFGVYRGFQDLLLAGRINRLPKMHGARTRDRRALSICDDDVSAFGLRAVRESRGTFHEVHSRELETASHALARQGVLAEPASAAAVAAHLARHDVGHLSGPEVSVCVVTGSGLKWPPL